MAMSGGAGRRLLAAARLCEQATRSAAAHADPGCRFSLFRYASTLHAALDGFMLPASPAQALPTVLPPPPAAAAGGAPRPGQAVPRRPYSATSAEPAPDTDAEAQRAARGFKGGGYSVDEFPPELVRCVRLGAGVCRDGACV